MRRIIFSLIITLSLLIVAPTNAFADTTCSGGQLCTTLGDGTPYCQADSGCSNPTGPCTCSPGKSYTCPFNGGFSLIGGCGPAPAPYHPPIQQAPTAAPISGLTLSPSHGCLNTIIHATLIPTEEPVNAYFDTTGQPGISASFLVDGFPTWVNNTITLIPNQTMQYDLPVTNSGVIGGKLLGQVSNSLDYSSLTKGPGAYPITFTTVDASKPPTLNAMYTVDASCFPFLTSVPTAIPTNMPTNAPIPTQIPTPTNTPIPTVTPSCHQIQVCPTGPGIQVCTFICQ